MYLPLNINLDMEVAIDERLLVDQAHPLWQRLMAAGAKPVGDDRLAAMQVRDRIGRIPYCVRRGLIESADLQIDPSVTLLDALLAGDMHPFWRQVGLDGVPYLWGAATVIYTRTADGVLLLLGEKLGQTDHGLPATFGGLWSSPSGIVETDDFVHFPCLRDGLIYAAIREMNSETSLEGLYVGDSRLNVQHHGHECAVRCEVGVFIEMARCKPQAFVIFQVDPSLLLDGDRLLVESGVEREYECWMLHPLQASHQSQLSPEARLAIQLIMARVSS